MIVTTHLFEGFMQKKTLFYCNCYYKHFIYKNHSKNTMQTTKANYVSVMIG